MLAAAEDRKYIKQLVKYAVVSVLFTIITSKQTISHGGLCNKWKHRVATHLYRCTADAMSHHPNHVASAVSLRVALWSVLNRLLLNRPIQFTKEFGCDCWLNRNEESIHVTLTVCRSLHKPRYLMNGRRSEKTKSKSPDPFPHTLLENAAYDYLCSYWAVRQAIEIQTLFAGHPAHLTVVVSIS